VALIGLENQTAIDKTMPLRVMGYDGASYRQQLLNKNQKSYYPVVTIVLYFGKQRWNKNRTLYECINVPEELKPFVNDYKVNVFEISYLTDEQVNMFKGDFKLVADYFVHTRDIEENELYTPKQGEIKHLWELLCLMKAVTGNNSFEETYSEFDEKEGVEMADVIEKMFNNKFAQYKIRLIIKLHKDNITNARIAEYVELTEEEVNKILKNNNLE
jgi:hypothetical protein